MARRRKKIGEILVSWKLLSQQQLDEALAYAGEHGKRIGEALVELQVVSEEDVTKALATQFDMGYVDLDKNVISPEALELVPQDIIRRQMILPVSRQNNRLKVIVTDPLDLETPELLRFRLDCDVDCMLAPPSKVRTFIDKYLSTLDGEIQDAVHSIDSIDVDVADDGDATLSVSDDLDAGEAPIIRLINLMISEAVNNRASDIHVEPMTDRVRVRYRIDGVCVQRDNIPKSMQGAVITRLKIMAGIDIAEKRMPQDGRIKMRISGQQIDFRVSALPSYHGESVVLRILRPEGASMGIRSLGFEEDDYQVFQRIIRRPNGIFLVTGPTGSGKTTTLYGALQELNRPDRKIITAEDPIEYNFTGMNQCQVREEIGLTFARILRAMLRQAPNIILVGEIRDLDVAEVAIQAALTGHLVFSTLHTNDAPSALTRMIDMGVKPFLVASAIQAVMAQRLIRVICDQCKEVDPNPAPYLLKALNLDEQERRGRPIYHGRGCRHCNNTGYHGRLGIFEMMVLNSELRDLAFKQATVSQIRQAARAGGMKSLVEDGKTKILNGVTTLEEIARLTQAETAAMVES
jgi:type IV pilus assembly protein PilB